MIATSRRVMFGRKRLNSCALDHVFSCETRTCMAVRVGTTVAMPMQAFMGAWTRTPRPALSSWQPATGNRQPATGNRQPAIGASARRRGWLDR
jgi:hypothetical protein